MTISELISQLESIREKQGDCEVWVDVKEFEYFSDIAFVVGSDYSDSLRINKCYVVLEQEVE